jgi:hypothetical protein
MATDPADQAVHPPADQADRPPADQAVRPPADQAVRPPAEAPGQAAPNQAGHRAHIPIAVPNRQRCRQTGYRSAAISKIRADRINAGEINGRHVPKGRVRKAGNRFNSVPMGRAAMASAMISGRASKTAPDPALTLRRDRYGFMATMPSPPP